MSDGRISHIDGLRGIAALVVLVQHVAEVITRSSALDASQRQFVLGWIADDFNLGRFGVILFFMLSGFVIPFSFRSDAPLKSFVLGRFFRMYPTFWVSLLSFMLFAYMAEAPIDRYAVGANITMIPSVFGQNDAAIVYWTLRYEIAFYVLCGLLFLVGRHTSATTIAKCVALNLVAVLCIVASNVVLLQHFCLAPLLNFALMFLGTLVRLAFVEGDAKAKKLVLPLALACCATIPLAVFNGFVVRSFTTHFGMTAAYMSAVACFLLAVATRRPRAASLAWLGAISYPLYLFHPIAIALASGLLVDGTAGAVAAFVTVTFTTSLAMAVFMRRVVEVPCIEWGRRVIGRIQSKAGRGALATVPQA